MPRQFSPGSRCNQKATGTGYHACLENRGRSKRHAGALLNCRQEPPAHALRPASSSGSRSVSGAGFQPVFTGFQPVILRSGAGSPRSRLDVCPSTRRLTGAFPCRFGGGEMLIGCDDQPRGWEELVFDRATDQFGSTQRRFGGSNHPLGRNRSVFVGRHDLFDG